MAVRSNPRAIPASLAFTLTEGEPVGQFPDATAELLICLSNCSGGIHAAQLAAIDARLPTISEQVRARIDEAFARAGKKTTRNEHRV